MNVSVNTVIIPVTSGWVTRETNRECLANNDFWLTSEFSDYLASNRRPPMDSSGLFNQEELSDVVLRLVVDETVEDPTTGSLKRARSAEPEEPETRLLFLHKFALYASPYFKSRQHR